MPQPAIMCRDPYHPREGEHECVWFADGSYCCKYAVECRNEDCESSYYVHLCANEAVHDFFNKHHVVYDREAILLAMARGVK